MKNTRGGIAHRTKIEAGFALALAVILALGVSAYITVQKLLQANRWVTHTLLVQEKLEQVHSIYQEAETATRGYVLTGQEQYLEPYHSALAHSQSDLDALKGLISDNSAQKESLGRLQALSDAKFANLRQTIELRKQSGLDAALQVIGAGQGKQIMDDLRGVVAEMQNREQDLLKWRNAYADAAARGSILILAVGTPLSLLLLTLLAMFISRAPSVGPVARSGAGGGIWASIVLRYSFAAATVVLAALLRWRFEAVVGSLPKFVTFYPAVLLVASIAGGGPGILATLLSGLLVDYYFIHPYHSLGIDSANDFLALSIFLGTCLFLCVLAERLKRTRWAEAVARQKELLAVTLASIGDAVIVTDIHGRVTFLNGEAEKLTGWKSADAELLPLQSVFRIVNEHSRQAVQDPVEKVLRLGSVVGLANHTILLARDGREIPIDDSGAPVRDAAGNVIGVVLVFRDFSQKKEAERVLQANLQRFYAVLSGMYAGILLVTDQGRVEFANAAFCDYYGLKESPAELAGLGSDVVIEKIKNAYLHPEQAVARIREILQRGRPVKGEEVALRDGGAGLRDFVPLNLQGMSFGRLWIHSDITPRKRAEEAQAKLAAIVESSDDAILSKNLDGMILSWNAAAERLLGYKPEEIIGKSVNLLLPPERMQEEEQILARLQQSERIEHLETIRLAKDGRRIDVSVTVSPIKDQEGQVVGASKIMHDITRRKRADEQLRLYLNVLQSADNAIVITGADGTIQWVNPSFTRLTGYTAAEAIGNNPRVLKSGRHEDAFYKHLWQTVAAGRVWHGELVNKRKDGRFYTEEMTITPVCDAAGKVTHFIAIKQDISQRKEAQEALRLSEERFRMIFTTMTEGFSLNEIVLDEAGKPCDLRYLAVNPAFERHLGRKGADLVGRSMLELFPDTGKEWIQRYGKVALWGEPAHFEGEFGPLGRWFDVSAFQTERGRFAVIFADITQRRRAEDDLRKLNRALHALSSSNQAILRASDELPYVQEVCANVVRECGHAMAWVGYALQDDEKTVEPIAHAGHEQDYLKQARISWADTERGRGPTGTAIRTGQPVICNNMLTDPRFGPWRREAAQRGYAASIALPLIAEGKPFGALTIYSSHPAPFLEEEVNLLSELAGDLAHGIISLRLRQEHAHATEALRQSQEQYHRLFNTLLEGFCIIEVLFDADGRPCDYRFLEINPAFEAQTGLHDAQGKLMRELAPEHEKHWFELYGEVALTGRPTRFVNEAKALNRWYDVSAYRVGGPDSRKVAILFNDITERVLAERELVSAKVSAERAKEAAEAATNAKDQFLAVLSHELRTPLNPALLAATILEKDPSLSPELRQDVGVIRRNVELEARLIDDMLDLTRIARGKLALARRIVDAREALTHAVETCHPEAVDKGLSLEARLPVQPIHVYADPARLQQVFWNLLKNAVKFTSKDGRITVRALSTAGGGLRVEVSDTGRGIEPDALGRIFDAFEQGDASITRRYGGLGLGLAICKELVEMHDGSIRAFSEGRGKGSTFVVELPPPGPEDQPAPMQPEGVIESVPTGSGKYRILLVEDHESTALMTARLLNSFGHDVTVVTSVQSALNQYTHDGFDLLISDLGLPDGSGQDLLRQLRLRWPVKAIALSGYGMDSDLQQSAQAGFLEHLIKPINAQQLGDAIKRVMGIRVQPIHEPGK